MNIKLYDPLQEMKTIKKAFQVSLLCVATILISPNTYAALITDTESQQYVDTALKPIGTMNLDVTPQQIKDWVNTGILTKGEAAALPKLIEASKEIHKLYLYQQNVNGPGIYDELKRNYAGTSYLKYFKFNWSTWDSRNEEDPQHPFINTTVLRAPGVNFYPKDMTADEFSAWIEAHPKDAEDFNGYFTVIKRDKKGGLFAVPYSKEYKTQLAKPAQLLRDAAQIITKTDKGNSKLATYLNSRATAFLTNNYRPSDVDWLNLNGNTNLLVTIGPYETGTDELLELKASFMSMVLIKDVTRESEVAFLDDNRNFIINKFPEILPVGLSVGTGQNDYQLTGSSSGVQFVYVNEIYSGGDYRKGAVIGFFLPNDSLAPGSRNHIISNTGTYKGVTTLLPIAEVTLSPIKIDNAVVNVNDFNDHTTLHEYGHSMEPKFVVGTTQPVQELLLEQTNTIHEATADSFGMVFHRWFIGETSLSGTNQFLNDNLASVYYTDVASIMRTLRFGFVDSHARGAAIQLMWLMSAHTDPVLGAVEPAVTIDSNGIFSIVSVDTFSKSYVSLTRYLLTIQTTGDYAAAKALRESSIAAFQANANIQKAFDNINNFTPSIPADFIKVYPNFDGNF